MRVKYTILVGVTLLAKTAFSQEEPSKVDFYGVYSYLRFNPTLPGVQSHNLNGGGGGATFFLQAPNIMMVPRMNTRVTHFIFG